MDIDSGFARIGARVAVHPVAPARIPIWRRRLSPDWLPPVVAQPAPRIDVRHDRKGEYFDILLPSTVDVEVIDADADARHLVLLARLPSSVHQGAGKARYLCGHDERHWFVAAVPESFPATTVAEAKRALQPRSIRDLTVGLNGTKRIARHNAVYRRQGEWFFLPEPDFAPNPSDIILRSEPLRRDARSKPHVVAEAVRSGGETRYQAERASVHALKDAARAEEIRKALDNRTLTKAEKERAEARFPEVSWKSVLVNPTMYVRGPVRHSDHATLDLKGWHRVVMNTEGTARAMSHVAFID